MSEDTQKYTDAYNLFASIAKIAPKDYTSFQVKHDGDVLTVIPIIPKNLTKKVVRKAGF
jgi:hypothetical protein